MQRPHGRKECGAFEELRKMTGALRPRGAWCQDALERWAEARPCRTS